LISAYIHVGTVLRDGLGFVVGELTPDRNENMQAMKDAGETGMEIHVVVISRGFDCGDPQPAETEFWTSYNVLWVEWADGIACRNGLGRIKRRAWDALDVENITWF
jgi:hypothetical protein